MNLQEYIATGSEFSELLAAVEMLPSASVTKTSSRYIVFQAYENDVESLRKQFAGKYTIAPNAKLEPFDE
ncbi:hypothetical protein GCM10010168_75180 [Actinoplanes ianthinogenes]|uniref:Uncharacterized protein n=1 Tax=Actinoplanes ianthinogenes TaxID=122358 RepID=A0ABM7LRD6_9ACTN|nr:hypothetical protein [Actinoplanes ianthinogenes]BCJ41830.1 hypothetical protein Aiant_24870 [Actinoplanes ianthinogenes]GGR45412.1 hypothetical protein GCM10010168_75180 [Actinoplanes ianthinogenes]